jgi:hypothetical protein
MTLACGTVRGLYEAGNGSLYVVKGEIVYEIHNRTGTMTAYNRGTLGSDTTRVYMADNGNHVCIVDGNNMYLHEMSTNNSIFANAIPFSGPSHVVFIGSYLVCNSTVGSLEDRGRIWYSGIFDALTWNVLSYANAEGFSDPIQALAVNGAGVWLMGVESKEVWRETGDSNQPFARVGGSFSRIGCRAKDSVAVIGESVFWIGSSKAGADTVYMSNGYDAQPISDITISQRLGNPIDAIGWTYAIKGHTSYVITMQGEDTWVFDLSTTKWYRRQARNEDGSPRSWKARLAEYHDGKTIVGFDGENYIAYLDTAKYIEADGKPIVRTFRSNNVSSEGKPVMFKELSLVMDTGRSDDYTDDPQVMVKSSDNGGYSWGRSKWLSYGKVGQYKKQISFPSAGVSRERCFEIQVSSNAKATLLNAYVEAEVGLAR